MIEKDFWRNQTVAVIGAGSWGTVLANLCAQNCREVRLWTRHEEHARQINSTRTNQEYLPELQLHERLHAYSDKERLFEGGVQAVIWALPSAATRTVSKEFARFIQGHELVIHATKGIETGTLKRISQILREELPCPRIGVVSGPNLAKEVAGGEPAATVVASDFEEVISAGQNMLASEKFRVYTSTDVIGVEWAGTLKNILAIASGALDAMKYGWNARSMLITRGLAEMVRFGMAMGGKEITFLGLAGVGDLMATCGSPLSRNYRVGMKLAQGQPLDQVLQELGATAEGVGTTRIVQAFAREHRIEMPITTGVYYLLEGKTSVEETIRTLMGRPQVPEF